MAETATDEVAEQLLREYNPIQNQHNFGDYNECFNACSGHGTCGKKHVCSCYKGWQGNDCAERTCFFGTAFTDHPKGDLNNDGLVSGE
jgi:hypothetical protein